MFSEGGLQPRNLRCLFNGGDRLTCSWEVKKVITTSVLFGLFFRATPESQYVLCPRQCVCASPMGLLPVPSPWFPFILFLLFREEECSPVHEKTLPHIPYMVQSCEIPVSNSSSQSQYRVSVRAKTEEKMIEAYKNSEFLCCFLLLLLVSWRDTCLSKWGWGQWCWGKVIGKWKKQSLMKKGTVSGQSSGV